MRTIGLVVLLFPTLAAAQAKPAITVGANVQVSGSHPNDGVSESWLSADPKDPDRLLACAIVYPTGKNRRNTAAFLSVDGGRSWRTTLDMTSHVDAGDPACALGPNGVANFISLAFLDLSSIEVVVYKSTDGGSTWQQQETASVRASGIDRESMIVDATGGRYSGRVYITGETGIKEIDKLHSARNGIGVWTSTDGGAQFKGPIVRASPVTRYTSGIGNTVILKDGTLLTLFGENLNADTLGFAAPVGTKRPSAIIEVVASKDGGETYEPAVKIADKYRSEIRTGEPGTPSLAADPGSASFGTNVYAAWTDYRAGVAQILLARSTDKGRTWSAPQLINDVAPLAGEIAGPNAFIPNVAVNRDGVVLVTWYDRHDTPGNLGWRLRARASLDGGDTWLPSVAVSSAMNRYDKKTHLTLWARNKGGGAREYWNRGGEIKLQLYMQVREFWAADYSGLAADASGVFHALWTDNRTGVPQLWSAPITVSGMVARNGDPQLANLVDVSSKVALEVVGDSLDRTTGKAAMTVRLVNTSTDTLRGPFKVRALGLSSALAESIAATNATNGAAGAGAVWDFTSAVPGGLLLPNAVSELRPMTFSLQRERVLYGEEGLRSLIVEMPLVVLASPAK
ncbi:MAG TPA: sialidase family protein [Gemmatimonadaceae bacterium]|nr:sialidase family protein [Gemmatimonadaceae bacterium]